MRLTYCGPLPPHPGGIAQHGRNLTNALVSSGNAVQRLSWRRPYPARLYPGDLVDPLEDPWPVARYSLDWFDPGTWWRAGRTTRTGDAVVIPWVTTFHAMPYEVLLRASGRPAVCVLHNALPHERHLFDEAITRRVLRRFDAALVHATSLADDASRLAPHLRVHITPHPPNLPLSAEPLPPAAPLRILVFGMVRAYKGTELALDAMHELDDRSATMTIAGTFWEPIERWQREVDTRGLGDRVRLDDRYVPDAEVGELFASHHLVVAPYRSATQSGIVPLAQAAGRPVVATDVGGLAEAVEDGVAGRVVPPGDAVALAAAITDVAGDLERYAAASRNAAGSWRDVARAVVGLFG